MDVRHVQYLIILLGFLSSTALEEHTLLQSAKTLPEMDVVTPLVTVPVVNPATTTNPVYNPFPTMTPIANPYTTPAMVTPASSWSGQSWCVASQTASQTALQVALDYACGYGGADCSVIQKGGSCFDPDIVRDHASYAFNDYYQRNPNPTQKSCDFGGTAIITNVDPSTSTCHYQSTSTSFTVLNTTYPSGSYVYGSSVPPSTSSSTSISNSISLLHISLICVVMLSLELFSLCKELNRVDGGCFVTLTPTTEYS